MMTAETTIRIELLKFYENLYKDETGLRDPSGWKCHFAKNYVQSISLSDIRRFVKDTLKRMDVDKGVLDEKSVDLISEKVYNNYKYTIDGENIAFVLKSKTVMNKDDDNRSLFRKVIDFIKEEKRRKRVNSKID